MSKGTAAFGKKSGKKTHIKCRRCGRQTYHMQKKRCASCGFGETSAMRHYNWAKEH